MLSPGHVNMKDVHTVFTHLSVCALAPYKHVSGQRFLFRVNLTNHYRSCEILRLYGKDSPERSVQYKRGLCHYSVH